MGTTGLCFYGLPGQSIASIQQQQELADFCRTAVDNFVSLPPAWAAMPRRLCNSFRLINSDDKLNKMAARNPP